MHELSIAQSIFSIAEKTIPEGSSGVITGISLQIGELSSIEIDSLQFAFSAIKEDTLLNKAELNIEVIQGEAECQDCHTIFPMNGYGTCCPTCKGYTLKILKGKELKMLSITMDE
ncbi:MAG TPA: hydrogenase maturation nickel metallochaperone HypA [Chitinophagaceae bacterium]|nr:hydrogenase maturation nickel metallochaperone HypA [Chitinophagaceae bacterium]